MKVIVYGTDDCPWCRETRKFLKEHKVKFLDKNVGRSRKAAQEMVKKSGHMGVPVIDVDGKIIVGFNEAELEKALKL